MKAGKLLKFLPVFKMLH